MNVQKLLIVTTFFAFALGFCQSNTALFTQATTYYSEGDYTKAIANYEQILKNGQHSAALYYNLGNSYYKQNAIGPSIYYYEKALLLKPEDTEIQNNLHYAQNMRLDAIVTLPQTDLLQYYNTLVHFFSFDQWAYAAVVWALLFAAIYLTYFFLRRSRQKQAAFTAGIFCVVFCGISLLMAYINHQDFKKQNPAIIFSKEAVVTAEPNANSKAVFSLHEGTKVNVSDHLGDWSKIRLENGQTGWIKRNHFKLLKDF